MLQYKWGFYFYTTTLPTLFNLFVQCNYMPELLKLNINVALPKFKHNDPLPVKQNPSNYRYIGLQPSIFKILD